MLEKAPPSAGEVRALAHQLMAWADHLSSRPVEGEMTADDRKEVILSLAVAARAGRRLRTETFAEIQLRNPGWDVMLDLFIQELSGFRTSLDHVALTGDLPAAAVYETVDTLTDAGLIESAPDRFDARVVWLSLSARGRQGMSDLFARAIEFVRAVPGGLPDEQGA